jgi:hypothetical protein
MNGINTKAIISLLLGLVMGIYVMVEVLLARSSSIGQLYLFAAIGALLMGLTNPRSAVYLMLVCTVYIDTFKRLMVIGGNPNFTDVAYVLAIPPLLIAGAVISVFLGYTVGRKKITKDVGYSFIVSMFVVGASSLGMVMGDSLGGNKLSALVNQAFYSFLFFLIPTLFPSDEERRRLLHFTFLLLIPSVLYSFWQKKFGYADFEYQYLMSGLTIEAKNLVESIGGELRCFSTFNGAGTASTMFSIYVLYCLVPLRPDNHAPSYFQRCGKWLLAPLFVLAAYFTIIRTGWVGGVGSLLAYFFLGTRLRAYTGITSAVVGFLFIIVSAPTAIKNNWLGEIEVALKNTVGLFTNDPTVRRAIVMGTAKDRLQGWANLTQEPKIWQPLGFKFSNINAKNTTNANFQWGHDAIVDALIRFGYIPLALVLIAGSYFFYKILQFMFQLDRRSQSFKNCRLCLASAAAILVGGLGHGETFRNFPQNFYFSLWLAIPYASYQQAMRERKNASASVSTIGALPATYPALANAAQAGMNASR